MWLPPVVPGSLLPHVWQPVFCPISLILSRSSLLKSRPGPRAGIDSPACGPSCKVSFLPSFAPSLFVSPSLIAVASSLPCPEFCVTCCCQRYITSPARISTAPALACGSGTYLSVQYAPRIPNPTTPVTPMRGVVTNFMCAFNCLSVRRCISYASLAICSHLRQ